MDLLAFERKLDQTIARKRMEIQEAIKKPIMVCSTTILEKNDLWRILNLLVEVPVNLIFKVFFYNRYSGPFLYRSSPFMVSQFSIILKKSTSSVLHLEYVKRSAN